MIVEYEKGKAIRVGDGLELPFTGIVKTAKGVKRVWRSRDTGVIFSLVSVTDTRL